MNESLEQKLEKANSELAKKIITELLAVKNECNQLIEQNRRYRFLLGLDEQPFVRTPRFLAKMEVKNGRGK